ncbi:MAG: hypothetical protein HC886_00220 [Leptolyngbyaceae cyanobacterium SM1_1_3]|nr:hypothetical protein [Leptolyngbyaceae cyanobacterium SM1_1_3]NJN01995.1 hypothetical protein [Leptolyngbyaceae cyanobacterium RM1_1_2]NJO10111.1 hypothetical protein [Leptolyngbyaceae cyanobacterium SL_1_1]
MLLISLGLHTLLLWLPLPALEKLRKPESLEVQKPDPVETINVIRLPAGTSAEPPVSPPAPPRQPVPAQTPQAETAPPADSDPISAADFSRQDSTEDTIANSEITEASPLDDKLKDIRFYSYSVNLTTESEATGSYLEWLNDLSVNYDLSPTRLSDPLVVPYEAATCLSPEPVIASVGVVVNPAGQVIEEPELLKSTGYDILNRKALVETKKRSFSAGNSIKAYSIEVQVQYDSATCTPPS